MKSPFRQICAALLLAGVAMAATAQQQALAPSEVLACLTPAEAERGMPIYPPELFTRRQGGRIAVELKFAEPDAAPELSFGRSDDDADLRSAVRAHVRRYRLPCLKPGQTAQLNQIFEFVPTDARKVRWLSPVDADDARKERFIRCIRHEQLDSRPDYPIRALRRESQGNVVVRATFNSAGAPPALELLDDGLSEDLARAALDFSAGLRMPCLEGAPIRTTYQFKFRLEDAGYTVLKDMSLLQLLGIVKGIRQANVYFDFKEMGCPFDLRFRLEQPYGLNRVGEVGEPNPERRFFLDWLRRQHLELPRATHNAVLGQITTVSVPCTVLDLGTASGGSPSQ